MEREEDFKISQSVSGINMPLSRSSFSLYGIVLTNNNILHLPNSCILPLVALVKYHFENAHGTSKYPLAVTML